MEARRLQTLRHQRRRDTEGVQHIQRWRVERRGARFLAECRSGLKYCHRHATVNQIGRRNQADRSGTGDEDALFHQAVTIRSSNLLVYSIFSMPALEMMSRYLMISAW